MSKQRSSEEGSDRRTLMSGSVDDPRIEMSIERKRNYTSSVGFQFDQEIGPRELFEHFLVVGIPPDIKEGDTIEPQILFIYPSTPLLFPEDDFNQTINFCFPNGIRPHKLEYKRSNIFLSEFAFRLAGASTSIYGICVHFIANPRRIPFFASEETLKYPFCFCILTKTPLLSVHFQYLTYMTLLYCRILDPSGKRKEQFPDAEEGTTLSNLEQEHGTARWPNTRYPDVLHDELAYFRSLRALNDRDSKKTLADGMILVIPPIQSDIKSLGMPTMDVLFSCLSVEDIVKLFTALLLEHHTIFRSKHIHLITMSVLAARTLLSPFKIGATLLPIVPNNPTFLQLLESPVPYICGIISTSSSSSISLPDNICIIDLDKGTLADPMLNVTLPRAKDLIHHLNAAIKQYKQAIVVPPLNLPAKNSKSSRNPKYVEFFDSVHYYMRPSQYTRRIKQKYVFVPPLVEDIMRLFSGHIAPKLEKMIKPCFVTDSTDLTNPVTVFNLDLFLASVKSDEEEFYREFCSTTIFQQFCDGKTDEMDITKKMLNDSSAPLSSHLVSSDFV